MQLRDKRKKSVAFEFDDTSEIDINKKEKKRQVPKCSSSNNTTTTNETTKEKKQIKTIRRIRRIKRISTVPEISTSDWNDVELDVLSLSSHITYFGHNKNITIGN